MSAQHAATPLQTIARLIEIPVETDPAMLGTT